MLYHYPKSILKSNHFIKCYDASYLEVTTSSDLGNCAGGEIYFVGLSCTSSNSKNIEIEIGAYGSEKIFEVTTSLSIAKYDRYGSYWFHVKEKCFGFSETSEIFSSDSIARESDNRLSWLLGVNTLQNETSCSILKYESEDYRKVIYVRRSPTSFDMTGSN